jgi:hypothetical protein
MFEGREREKDMRGCALSDMRGCALSVVRALGPASVPCDA